MNLLGYRSFVLAAAALLTLVGCAYTGGVETPVRRKFTSFSYAAGDDIKRRCVPGAPDQYRLIYNANWHEQVRTDDLRQSTITNSGGMLWVHVFGGSSMANFSFDDVQAPWRGVSSQRRLE